MFFSSEPLFHTHLSFLEFLSKMGSLRAFYARKLPIFDIFPRPVRGGVMGGVKEKAFFEILTKRPNSRAGELGLPAASFAFIIMITP
jgi:hypothetical protein